ncbi:SpoIIE family protein phosphatase [Frankia sp. CiP3]|uniref:SpoIIE family protein phosphatase n=1 Tax=Frankia sp. CiP3 TaxID=2880971 RepID=UPI001EF5551D|nr:SpoIIE family protein phosphatase [Frankia sp. CiP3]
MTEVKSALLGSELPGAGALINCREWGPDDEVGCRLDVDVDVDVRRITEELADMVVPGCADWVSVDLLDSVYRGGEPAPGRPTGPVTLRRTAYRSTIPDEMKVAVESGDVDIYPDFSPPARCLAAGRPVLHRVCDPEISRWVVDSPARAAAAYDHGFHSAMFIPLRARAATFGVVVLARRDHRAAFTAEDLLLADELGAKAALAIERARRCNRERAVALALQRGLLPQRLPEQVAVEVACRYRPASGDLGVGGDWFDVIPLSGARVALVVGDVAGRGIQAVAAMGRLRTAVRALTDSELPPEELLTRLDDLLARLLADGDLSSDQEAGSEIGATCLYAVYDPVSRRCSLASAGHRPPAVVTPDGTVTFLDVPTGPPLGLDSLPFEAVEVELPAGSLLALYTDGLIDSRGCDIDDGVDELRRVLAEPAHCLEAACDMALDVLLPEHLADDVALLLARTHGLDESQVASWDVPVGPAAVAQARAQAHEQLAAWALEELACTTELVVSELVTNAIRHGRGPVGLRLIRADTLICEVSDSSNAAPHPRRAHTLDEGGRGLLLVAQLTRRWGSRYTPSGKTIWAEQALPARRPLRVAADPGTCCFPQRNGDILALDQFVS